MRPVLMLIDGLPASGKSTLARAWCERHAGELPLALDVDSVRGMLGGWRAAPAPAGVAARALAVAMAGIHLDAGHDVVVPQFLARAGFPDQLAGAARRAGAGHVEVLLEVEPVEAERRFAARAAQDAAAGRVGVEGALERSLADVLPELEALADARPSMTRLRGGDRERSLDVLDALVAAARDDPPTRPAGPRPRPAEAPSSG